MVALNRLIAIRRRTDDHPLALPRWLAQLSPEHLGQVDLDEDLVLEIEAGIELMPSLVLPGEAVHAAMPAAAVRIDAPLEGHPLDGINGRAARRLDIGHLLHTVRMCSIASGDEQRH